MITSVSRKARRQLFALHCALHGLATLTMIPAATRARLELWETLTRIVSGINDDCNGDLATAGDGTVKVSSEKRLLVEFLEGVLSCNITFPSPGLPPDSNPPWPYPSIGSNGQDRCAA